MSLRSVPHCDTCQEPISERDRSFELRVVLRANGRDHFIEGDQCGKACAIRRVSEAIDRIQEESNGTERR